MSDASRLMPEMMKEMQTKILLMPSALEVAFLGGQERPTVERADADFNILGIQFRGYIDFGVREQDWCGALKVAA
jgi:hypothetical protein